MNAPKAGRPAKKTFGIKSRPDPGFSFMRVRVVRELINRCRTLKQRTWPNIFQERMKEIEVGIRDGEVYYSIKLVLKIAEAMIADRYEKEPKLMKRKLAELDVARETLLKLEEVTRYMQG